MLPGLARDLDPMRPCVVAHGVRTLRNIAGELAAAHALAADRRSFLRWGADILAYRLLRIVRVPGYNRPRTIHLNGGIKLTYRLNRGDLLVLREVWTDEVYRPPNGQAPRTVIDLGANVGMASVWFARRLGCREIVAVEPLPENARLLRHNLEQNGISATVVEAAVGAEPGEHFLAAGEEPCSGHLAESGLPVTVVGMESVILAFEGGDGVDLLKVDIEGAEEALFTGDGSWLSEVRTILVEIHPELVNVGRVVAAIEAAGFSAPTAPLDMTAGAVTAFMRSRDPGT